MKLILRGVPASHGLAVGEVLRVEEGVPVRHVEQGTPVVLVAAAAPSLRTLLARDDGRARIGGVVVERGGALSAMATLARELGVPAVFGAIDALAMVREGELILVDGGTGWVYRLDDATIGEPVPPESPTMRSAGKAHGCA